MTAIPPLNAERLLGFVVEIERAEKEIATATVDRSEILKSARDAGLDPKVLKRVVAERKRSPEARMTEEDLFEAYWHAVETQAAQAARSEAAA
jgi:uncharacterized protein (UPF0335 family)